MFGASLRIVICVICVICGSACAPVRWVGIQLFYDKADLPPNQILKNVAYDPSAPDDPKRQLDVFMPAGRDWPMVVFIHGGGWTWGDRLQKFGGADVYSNIGRFLAQQGFGAAVISYRLVWNVTWQDQAADIARAVAWVQNNMPARGARPKALFVMGHSAGAQLAMRVAVEPNWLQGANGSPSDICGVVAVSGAAYDLEDEVTQKLDTDKDYYRQRFMHGATEETWRRHASPLRSVDGGDPPFLLLLAASDYPSLHRQARLADEHLQKLGLSRGFVIVPEVDHERMVLELSRADHVAGPAILEFLRNTPCPR